MFVAHILQELSSCRQGQLENLYTKSQCLLCIYCLLQKDIFPGTQCWDVVADRYTKERYLLMLPVGLNVSIAWVRVVCVRKFCERWIRAGLFDLFFFFSFNLFQEIQNIICVFNILCFMFEILTLSNPLSKISFLKQTTLNGPVFYQGLVR